MMCSRISVNLLLLWWHFQSPILQVIIVNLRSLLLASSIQSWNILVGGRLLQLLVFHYLAFYELLINDQMLRWLILLIRIISLGLHHSITKYYLGRISALTLDLRNRLFLEGSWFSFKPSSRLVDETLFHIEDGAIRVLFNSTINIIRGKGVSLVFGNIFFAHIHNIGYTLASMGRFFCSCWIHIQRIHNLSTRTS